MFLFNNIQHYVRYLWYLYHILKTVVVIMPDKSMMNLRKLLLWILVSIIILCALRYGILECANQYIYNLRNTHFPSFAYRYDDFLPYIPVVIMFGMKLAGIKSRSQWKPMLISTVFSFALMGITICSIKSLAGVLRPDGSDFLSFLPDTQQRLLPRPAFYTKSMVLRVHG